MQANAKRRLGRPLKLVLSAALLVAGCSAPDPHSDAGQATKRKRANRGNHLVIGLQQEPDKLNSALNAMVYGTYVNQTIYGYFVK